MGFSSTIIQTLKQKWMVQEKNTFPIYRQLHQEVIVVFIIISADGQVSFGLTMLPGIERRRLLLCFDRSKGQKKICTKGLQS